MKKTLFIGLLIILMITACQKTEITESNFNETCQKKGYDLAIPISMGGEIVGFDCCTEIDAKTLECLDYYPIER
jgi:hypothetical protein